VREDVRRVLIKVALLSDDVAYLDALSTRRIKRFDLVECPTQRETIETVICVCQQQLCLLSIRQVAVLLMIIHVQTCVFFS